MAGKTRLSSETAWNGGATHATMLKEREDIAMYTASGVNIAGELVIQTNIIPPPTGNGHMVVLRLSGQVHAASAAIIDLSVRFLAQTSTVSSVSALNSGAFPVSQVRAMLRNSDNAVAIVITSGAASNFWQYPKVTVDAIFGFGPTSDSMLDGWTAEIATDLSALTTVSTVTPVTFADKAVIEAAWFKEECRVASTANIDLNTGGLLTIDGITVQATNRVLVKNQTVPAENGIYLAQTSGWTRAPDADTTIKCSPIVTTITQGTTQTGQIWKNAFGLGSTLGTTAMPFTRVLDTSQVASQSETDAGTNDERYVSPLKLQTRLDAYTQPRIVTGTTNTGVGTNAKTATISGYVPAAGDILALTLTNGNTALAPTLNVNSIGAVALQQTGPTPAFETAAGGIWLLYYTGSAWILLNTHDPVDAIFANKLSSGVENFSRDLVVGEAQFLSQRLSVAYFTCDKIFTATQMRIITGSQASSGATTIKLGLFLVNADSTLTLLAKTANNTALCAAIDTVYTEPFESGGSVSMVRAQRYAAAFLQDGGTMPKLIGQRQPNGNIFTYTPRLVGDLAGQTDIPSSTAALTGVARDRFWCVVLP